MKLLSLIVATALLYAPVQQDNPNRLYQLRELEKVKMTIKGKKFEIWLMDNMSKITEGMMWLTNKEVKDNQGMLFVYDDMKNRSFWMANCPLGLDIAFMNAKGKILNIQNGKPRDQTPLPSNGPTQYILEVKAGTLKKIGVKAGDTLQLPKRLSYKG